MPSASAHVRKNSLIFGPFNVVDTQYPGGSMKFGRKQVVETMFGGMRVNSALGQVSLSQVCPRQVRLVRSRPGPI